MHSLTDTKVRSLTASQKRERHFDGGGLYLEVSPKGGKWWRFKYRMAGKEKRFSLGIYPDTPLKAAREKANQARKLLAANVDPGAERKAVAACQTAPNPARSRLSRGSGSIRSTSSRSAKPSSRGPSVDLSATYSLGSGPRQSVR